MPFSHLRLSAPSLPVIRLPDTPFSPVLYYVVYCTQFQAGPKQSSGRVFLVKNKFPSCCLISSSTGVHASRALTVVDGEEIADVGESCEQKHSVDSFEYNFTDDVQLHSCSDSAESYEDQTQSNRRRKIGVANKGKSPWNKGRKHSKETRERIKERTKEALMDPKIRKKMSESHRAHSDQAKEKIRSALRRVWGERLKLKRSRGKLLSSWATSIAEAARKGGSDQQELHWDSYDKIKEEISLQHSQRAADRAKAKVRAAQAKAEKMASLALKREEKEQKAQAREVKKQKRKSKEEREELRLAQEIKLKEKLTKIHKRKASTNGQIICEGQRTWEKLDWEFRKREHTQREVSLADQIQAAKTKRVESVAGKGLPTSYSLHSARDHQSDLMFS